MGKKETTEEGKRKEKSKTVSPQKEVMGKKETTEVTEKGAMGMKERKSISLIIRCCLL